MAWGEPWEVYEVAIITVGVAAYELELEVVTHEMLEYDIILG